MKHYFDIYFAIILYLFRQKTILFFFFAILLAFISLGDISAQLSSTKKISYRNPCVSFEQFMVFLKNEQELNFYYDPEWFVSKECLNIEYVDLDIQEAIRDFLSSYNFQVFFKGNDVLISNTIIIESGFTHSFSRAMGETVKETKEKELNARKEEMIINEISASESEVISFGVPSVRLRDSKFHLRGTITETGTNQPVIGATVQIGGTTLGTITNINGKYDLLVTAGQFEIIYRAVGKLTATRQVSLFSDGVVNLSLDEEPVSLEEVRIVGKKYDRVNIMVGAESLDINLMKKSIMSFGEADLIKGLLTLPGVQTTNEVSTGFNVRGGNTDQNLILIDNAPILNASHFFGFFSAFNADIVEGATLYKSGIPPSLGGRISSIVDISSKSGNKEKFSVDGGISPFTARLNAEGPIIKNKLSFILSGRSTYSDYVLRRIPDVRVKNSAASFYDLLGNVHYEISKKQRLKLTLYMSNDHFRFAQISSNEYSNLASSLNYETSLSEKLVLNTSLVYSNYSFGMIDVTIPSYSKTSKYNINQRGINLQLSYNKNDWINIKFGTNSVLYNTQPGIIEPYGSESMILFKELEPEKALEGAVYLSNEQNITDWLSLLYGIRYSGIGDFGPKTIFDYFPGASKSIITISDTLYYQANTLIKTYSGIEPRFLARIKTGQASSVKVSYNETRQYINQIFNTISPAPTDIWKLSDVHFRPQSGKQFSIGYYLNFSNKYRENYSLSFETYYKKVMNMLDYKVGAELFANEHFETEIINGENKSYGLEIQLVKESGSINGWINYSYSRSLNKFDNLFSEETINFGDYFPANYDKPHNLKSVINYDAYKRLRFSVNLNYSSGRPVTLPYTSFLYGENKKVQFSKRNQFRLPDHFRVDISATFEGDYRLKKLLQGSFTFAVINVTGRKNPYSVLFQYDRFKRLKAYYLSIFGVPVPSLTYNFKF